MASYGRHEDQRSTLALIAAGFHEFTRTSGAYLAKVSFVHKFSKLMLIKQIFLATLWNYFLPRTQIFSYCKK